MTKIKVVSALLFSILACSTAIPVSMNPMTAVQTVYAADEAVETGFLYVSCYDETNDPEHTQNIPLPAGYTVNVTASDGKTYTAVTDASGRAAFENIPTGQCTVSFTGTSSSSTTTYAAVSGPCTVLKNITMTFQIYTIPAASAAKSMLTVDFCAIENGIPQIDQKYAPIGASVTITNKATGTSYTNTCNSLGVVEFFDIEEGLYNIKLNSVPEGYAIAVASYDATKEVKAKSTFTFHMPLYASDISNANVIFKLDEWRVASDEGDADQTKITYNLCQIIDGIPHPIKIFTYDDIIGGTALYTMTGDDRKQAWHLVMTNSDVSGYTALDTVCLNLTDNPSAKEIIITPVKPKIITNDVIIKGTPGDTVHMYLYQTNHISPYDTKTDVTTTIGSDGSVTIEAVPFGQYIIEDKTNNAYGSFSITEPDLTTTFTLPETKIVESHTYVLYDIFGNKIDEGTGGLSDIKKPVTQGDYTKLYKVMLYQNAGNPNDTIVWPAITASFAYIRMYSNGKIEELEQHPIGDCNRDDKFSVADIIALQKFLHNIDSKGCPNWKSIDLDCDDRLTVFDLCLAKRILLNPDSAKFVI